MATKKYLDYAGLKRVLAKLLPGARKIWHGTQAEWDALSAAERDKYDQAEIIGSTAEIFHIKPDWASAVAITAEQINAGYTAPSDGMVVGYILAATDGNLYLSINNIHIALARGFTTVASDGSIQVSVSAGDVVQSSSPVNPNTELHFVPWAN